MGLIQFHDQSQDKESGNLGPTASQWCDLGQVYFTTSEIRWMFALPVSFWNVTRHWLWKCFESDQGSWNVRLCYGIVTGETRSKSLIGKEKQKTHILQFKEASMIIQHSLAGIGNLVGGIIYNTAVRSKHWTKKHLRTRAQCLVHIRNPVIMLCKFWT